ncbi:trypsin-like serine peptidase, partial [Streptomyces beijiangensis]
VRPAAAAAPGVSHTVWSVASTAPVGALFQGSTADGNHVCTASVVSSKGRDLLVTAAHCLDGGTDGLVFVPGYHDGEEPYGEWKVTEAVTGPRWTEDTDEDADVAFAVVGSSDGERIQDVVGAYTLGVAGVPGSAVTVTGYPSDSDTPITCTNRAGTYTDSQWVIACPGYSGGTSGSPWVTADGTVIGAIGGYQRGGDTDDVSYSVRFDAGTEALFQLADR